MFHFLGSYSFFPQQLHYFTFPPAIAAGSSFSGSLTKFVIFLFLFLFFLMTAAQMSVKCDLVILIGISDDAERLSTCLLALCLSLEKCLRKSFAHFSVGCFLVVVE